LNAADAGSHRLRRAHFVGPVQPTPMQETEAFREGKGVKAVRIKADGMGYRPNVRKRIAVGRFLC
jgi:hypothetical protein